MISAARDSAARQQSVGSFYAHTPNPHTNGSQTVLFVNRLRSKPRLISEIRRGYGPTPGPQSDLVGIDALAASSPLLSSHSRGGERRPSRPKPAAGILD
jgi:hypothetical protein